VFDKHALHLLFVKAFLLAAGRENVRGVEPWWFVVGIICTTEIGHVLQLFPFLGLNWKVETLFFYFFARVQPLDATRMVYSSQMRREEASTIHGHWSGASNVTQSKPHNSGKPSCGRPAQLVLDVQLNLGTLSWLGPLWPLAVNDFIIDEEIALLS
jgi:hypothetical protein